jgi:hypothetical protein
VSEREREREELGVRREEEQSPLLSITALSPVALLAFIN